MMTAKSELLQPETWARGHWDNVRQLLAKKPTKGASVHLSARTVAGELARIELTLHVNAPSTVIVDQLGFEVDGEVLEPRKTFETSAKPFRLGLEGELIGTFDPASTVPPRTKRVRRRKRSLQAVAILAGGILLSGISTDIWGNAANGDLVVQMEGYDSSVKAATALDLEKAFADRIAGANLSDFVSIQRNNADNSLVAMGTIPASASPDWESALRWYDLQATGPTLVSKVSVEAGNASLPEVALIKLGDGAELVLRNSARLQEGDAVDGLILQEIAKDSLTFQRGLELITMPLGKEAKRGAH